MKLDAYWQFEGTLECTTAMHVGDGASTQLGFENGNKTINAEVQTVAQTVDGNARIPGTALKGVLRRACASSGELKEQLFGKMESGKMESGGFAQFLDANSDAGVQLNKDHILRRTAIDDIRGTAKSHQLFAIQMVPRGTRFNVRIRGKSYDSDGWKKQAGLLNDALSRFSGGGLQFGASDGNEKGKCEWTLGAVRVMDAGEITSWLKNPLPIDIALGGLPDRKREIVSSKDGTLSAKRRSVNIELNFSGSLFLVNDASKARKKGDPIGVGHSYVARRADGKLLLPAESMRGVLSHQAARIARTRGKSGERVEVRRGANEELPDDIGCVTRLFGGPGWRSVLDISDFLEMREEAEAGAQPAANVRTPNTKVQQFVAVDRFTAAGGSDGLKFDAEGGWQPRLKGSFSIDVDRLRLLGEVEPSLGLLALVLRDLADGDLTFGWGAGKGYGWCAIDTPVSAIWVEDTLDGLAPGGVQEWIKAWEERGR